MKYASLFSSYKILLLATVTLGGLTACDHGSWWKKDQESLLKVSHIQNIIPKRSQNREAWAQDIFNLTQQFGIAHTKENMCTIIAIIDQESNFVANPVVHGLGEKAVKEVQERLEEKFTEKLGESLGGTVATYFQDILKNHPNTQNNYLRQMRKVKTEKELDELYREIFQYMSQHYRLSAFTGAAKLVGQNIDEKLNPITTLGSMQVHISYAKEYKRQSGSMADLRTDLYTQYGGLYYGIHRLMMYPADYDLPIYRFADYNSGMYSSRNAAFQKMLNVLTQAELSLDGDLLLYNKDGNPRLAKSQTETQLIEFFSKHNILRTPRQIRADLKKEKSKKFETSETYKIVREFYEKQTGKPAIYAIMPQVIISGPKLSRDYNTNWFATRVNGRYQTCINKAKKIKI